jgi:hypothetical protein
LTDGLDNTLRARLEAGSGEKTIRCHNHEIEIFATGFVSELVNASGPRGHDARAVVTDIQDHDFNQVANTAIRIANQEVERFHQFEKSATAWWNWRNACVPARGKARTLPTMNLRNAEEVKSVPNENCAEVYRTETEGRGPKVEPLTGAKTR